MLEIKHMSKIFDEGTLNEKKALNDISIKIMDGDFVTIIGSNGAGKTTLFKCISGENRIDKGSIYLDNQNITYEKEYKRSSYIKRLFQNPAEGLAMDMTVKENLSIAYMSAKAKGNPFKRLSAKENAFMEESLEKINLKEKLNSKVKLLSGGQRQSLSLIMATIVTPKILLLDEHTSALDPKNAKNVMDLTNTIVRENHITCLMITHNMEQALKTGNRTFIMHNGKITTELSQEEKETFTVSDLLKKFNHVLEEDRNILTEM